MFGSKMELEEHSNSHTGEKPFECDICNARFNRRSTLWNHKRIHSDQKPFRCPICSMHFKWKNSLKCHKEMHLRKNETGPLDAEEFRIQLLSPSKRGRTARGGSRKRGASATAAASSVSVAPLATNGGRPASPDFSMLEDPTGYSVNLDQTTGATLNANGQPTQYGAPAPDQGPPQPPVQQQQRQQPPQPVVIDHGGNHLLSNPGGGPHHHDARMAPLPPQQQQPQRATSILQQALQQPVSPALSLAVHQGQGAPGGGPQPPSLGGGTTSSYQIYVHSLPNSHQQETKPQPTSTGGLLQPLATTSGTHYQLTTTVTGQAKLSPPTGATPHQTSRGESPVASTTGQQQQPANQQQHRAAGHLIQYLSASTNPRPLPTDDNNNRPSPQQHTTVSSSGANLPPVSYYAPGMMMTADVFTSSLLAPPPHLGQHGGVGSNPTSVTTTSGGCNNNGPQQQQQVPSVSDGDYMPNVDFMQLHPGNYVTHGGGGAQQPQGGGYPHQHHHAPQPPRMEHGYVVRELTYNEW